MKRCSLLLVLLLPWYAAAGGSAQFSVPQFVDFRIEPLFPADTAPATGSPSAVVLDAATGTILYSKNPTLPVSPASLTKLMTIHLALNEIAAGRADADELVPLPAESWAVNQPPRSSLMFLAENQRVTLGELLLGLAVPSGNDAAVAAALRFAPSVEAFTTLMNTEAGRLGLAATRFAEPAGISALNTTTAEDFARFSRYYLLSHPESLYLLHAVPEFAYPAPPNVPGGRAATILQYNHNPFLGKLEGADGLKTGHISEAGYNIVLTARRGTTRFIVVILGSQTEAERLADGEALLEWAFANFRTLRPQVISIPEVRIWKGKNKWAVPAVTAPLELTVSVRRAGVLEWKIENEEKLTAPLAAGTVTGTLVLSDDMGELSRYPLVLTETEEQGNIFRRAGDSITLFMRGIREAIRGLFHKG